MHMHMYAHLNIAEVMHMYAQLNIAEVRFVS